MSGAHATTADEMAVPESGANPGELARRFFSGGFRLFVPSGRQQVAAAMLASTIACAGLGVGLAEYRGHHPVITPHLTMTIATVAPAQSSGEAAWQAHDVPTWTAPAMQAAAATARQEIKPSQAPASATPAPFDMPETDSLRPGVVHAVQAAGHTTGVDPAVLMAMAYKESTFKVKAHNHHSSATGLFQFTNGTWVESVRTFGDRYGLTRFASAIVPLDDGSFAVKHGYQSKILKLRDDPKLSAAMAAERTQACRHKVETALGRDARPVDLYMLHLLGDSAGMRFLKEARDYPGRRVDAVVGSGVTHKNAGIFVADGRVLTAGEVYRNQDAHISALVAHYGAYLTERTKLAERAKLVKSTERTKPTEREHHPTPRPPGR